jgi:hypothetical protein
VIERLQQDFSGLKVRKPLQLAVWHTSNGCHNVMPQPCKYADRAGCKGYAVANNFGQCVKCRQPKNAKNATLDFGEAMLDPIKPIQEAYNSLGTRDQARFLALVTEGTAVERKIAERFLARKKKEGKKKHPPRVVADQSGTLLEKDGTAISERASEIKSDALSDAKPATLRGWASCANDQGRREGKTGTVSAPRHSTASRL